MEILQLIIKEKIKEKILIPLLERVLNNELVFYKKVQSKGVPYPYSLYYKNEGFKTIIDIFLGDKMVSDMEIALIVASELNTSILIDPRDEAFNWSLVKPNGDVFNVNEKFTIEENDFIKINFDSMVKWGNAGNAPYGTFKKN